MSRVFIIAEAGVNHNGNSDLAFQLVDAAVLAGADAVKFQTFKAENIVTQTAQKANYQLKTTQEDESQLSMLKRLELSHDTHKELIRYCDDKGIQFLSTAFDLDSLAFLTNQLLLKTLKIPSGEITNGPLLLAHARIGCELILSTGMASLGEIEEALGVIAFGFIYGSSVAQQPSRSLFNQSYNSVEGQNLIKNKVTLLHCTTEYPAPLEDVHLNAMTTLNNAFGTKVGYSDHTEGTCVSIAAVAMGAKIIEKHFTLDKSLPGPDHQASLNPQELTAMVAGIRSVELAMGGSSKGPKLSELKNREMARKSLIAGAFINKGDVFSEQNLVIKRPGTGITPMKYWKMIGTKSNNSYLVDEIIKEKND